MFRNPWTWLRDHKYQNSRGTYVASVDGDSVSSHKQFNFGLTLDLTLNHNEYLAHPFFKKNIFWVLSGFLELTLRRYSYRN